MRFHVATLLGLKEGQDLPPAASAEEMKLWMTERPIAELAFNIDLGVSGAGTYTEQTEDDGPHTERKEDDGPQDPRSSPQQISVLKQMMKAVRVSKFRPDFSASASSKPNKWLWDLAIKMFIKLVECGEYTGIPITKEGIRVIKKSFDSHVQSLMKRYVHIKEINHLMFDFKLHPDGLMYSMIHYRYRAANWEAARKQLAAEEARRATRLRHVSTAVLRVFNTEKE